jgi:integrase/recombinase XerD
LGVAVNPHLFRGCAATSVAIQDPGHVGVIKSVLGHRSLATGQSYYNQAGSLEASRRHQGVLRRAGGRPEPRRRGRREE